MPFLPDLNARRAGLFMIALFFALSLGVIRLPVNYHGDERYYTDAAIRMIQTGDFWTPYFLDGQERFQKPVLGYWLMVSSFEMFGINMLASRLWSLVAAVGLVLTSVAIYRALFGRDGGARAVIPLLLTNSTIFLIASRATPDMLAAFFINISLLGFIHILTGSGTRRSIYPWLAYIGAGLAVATKGGLGILPVAFALIICFVVPTLRARWRKLWHAPSILLGLAIALFWFAAMLELHGGTAWQEFFSDQVGAKIGSNAGRQLEIIAGYLLAPLRHFLPWSLLLVPYLLRHLPPFFNEDEKARRVHLVIFIWLAVVLTTFCFGNVLRTRYLLPMYPVVACLLARLLVRISENETWSRRSTIAARIITSVVCFAGVLLVVAGWRLGLLVALAGIVIVIITSRAIVRTPGIYALSLSMMVLLFGIELAVKPVIISMPEAAHAERLLAVDRGRMRVAAAGLPGDFLSKVNLLAGGKLEVVCIPTNAPPDPSGTFDAISLSESVVATLPAGTFDIQPLGELPVKWKPGMIREWILSADPATTRRSFSKPCYLAIRRTYLEAQE